MTRVTLVTLVTFVAFVPGCGALGIDFHDRRGDSTLNLEEWRTGDPLHEPYRAKMVREDGAPPAATVRFDAEGWERATYERTSPTGQQTLDRMDATDLNANRTGISFDAPGRWHVRLSDSSGCVHEFEIEVTPPSPTMFAPELQREPRASQVAAAPAPCLCIGDRRQSTHRWSSTGRIRA